MLYLKRLENISSEKEYGARLDRFAGINMLDDQSIMPQEESPKAENVSFEGGRLKRIEGFEVACWENGGQSIPLRQLPEDIERLFEFQGSNASGKGYRNFYYSDTSGNLYRFVLNAEANKIEAEEINCEFEKTGYAFSYFTPFKVGADTCALVGGVGCGPYVYYEDGSICAKETVLKPRFKRCAMHYSRMFGVGSGEYPQRIWFSKIDEPWNFDIADDAGGYIDINDLIGNAIDVVSFFDTLYVFCRYGIVAVNSLSEQSDFSVENIYYSDSEIIDGSICICKDKIMFATRNGVYALSSQRVVCASQKISGFFEKSGIICQNESSVFFKNRYFLTFHRKNGNSTSGILIYNFASGLWEIFAKPNVISMAVFRDSDDEKLLMAFKSSTVVMEWGRGDRLSTSGAIESLWQSPINDWGITNCVKSVRELHFTAFGEGELTVSVLADGLTQSRTIALTETEKVYRLPFDASGELLGIEIKNSYGNRFSVSPVTIIYTLKRERIK